jgi:hypothetical protein
MGKIKSESMRNHNVVLYETFDYTSKLPFSRKIVLESGEGYIDEKPQDDNTSIEHILKSYFRLKSISVKPK